MPTCHIVLSTSKARFPLRSSSDTSQLEQLAKKRGGSDSDDDSSPRKCVFGGRANAFSRRCGVGFLTREWSLRPVSRCNLPGLRKRLAKTRRQSRNQKQRHRNLKRRPTVCFSQWERCRKGRQTYSNDERFRISISRLPVGIFALFQPAKRNTKEWNASSRSVKWVFQGPMDLFRPDSRSLL